MGFKIDNSYKNWLKELKAKVHSAQIKAALAVNTELIQLYWGLGKMISEKFEESQWGDKVLQNISNDLKEEFPNVGGLSVRNLKYCKYFYNFYSTEIRQQAVAQLENSENKTVQQLAGQTNTPDNKQSTIRQQAIAQIPWGHNILIFTKCKDIETADKTEYTIYDFYPTEILSDNRILKVIPAIPKDSGPTGTLNALIEATDFFDSERTLKEIVNKANEVQNQSWQGSNFTQPLANSVKKNRLKLTLVDGQNSYTSVQKTKKD